MGTVQEKNIYILWSIWTRANKSEPTNKKENQATVKHSCGFLILSSTSTGFQDFNALDSGQGQLNVGWSRSAASEHEMCDLQVCFYQLWHCAVPYGFPATSATTVFLSSCCQLPLNEPVCWITGPACPAVLPPPDLVSGRFPSSPCQDLLNAWSRVVTMTQ